MGSFNRKGNYDAMRLPCWLEIVWGNSGGSRHCVCVCDCRTIHNSTDAIVKNLLCCRTPNHVVIVTDNPRRSSIVVQFIQRWNHLKDKGRIFVSPWDGFTHLSEPEKEGLRVTWN